MYARIAYAAATLIVLAVYGYIYTRITARNDNTKIRVPREAKGWEQVQNPALVDTTVSEYDQAQLKKVVQNALFSGAITTVLHFQFGFVQHLPIQAGMMLVGLYSAPLIQAYLLGQTVKRPFVEENPLVRLFKSAAEQNSPRVEATQNAENEPSTIEEVGDEKKEEEETETQEQETETQEQETKEETKEETTENVDEEEKKESPSPSANGARKRRTKKD